MRLQLIFFISVSLLHLSTSQNFQLPNSKQPFIDLITNRFQLLPKLSKSTVISHNIVGNRLNQRIDHFNPSDRRTFSQYFSINDEFFTSGGPIFIFLFMSPSYANIGELYLTEGPVHSMAQNFNGTIVYPHHRFFDNSQIFDEFSVENLRFLSINQVLGDLAHLIHHLKSDESRADSGVILVGWDYGASIATWFAQKYPHMVTGIWASGGKISPSLEHSEVIEMVEHQLREFGTPGCAEKIENAFKQINEMLANNQSDIIRRRFNLCFPIPHRHGYLDIQYLHEILTVNFYVLSMIFDKTYIENYSCGPIMNAPVEHDWEALGYANGLMGLPFPLCYPNSISHQLDFLMDTDATSEFAVARANLYLECTEYGFFFNSGDGMSIFGRRFPSSFYAFACEHLFGITEGDMEENYRNFNIMHGARRPIVPNAYFTYGELYPWIESGIDSTEVHNSSIYEIVPMRSLHTELSVDINDPHFAEVKRRIYAAIRRWLS